MKKFAFTLALTLTGSLLTSLKADAQGILRPANPIEHTFRTESVDIIKHINMPSDSSGYPYLEKHEIDLSDLPNDILITILEMPSDNPNKPLM